MAEQGLKESDKLKGIDNYYVWSLKMRAMLHAKGYQPLTEEEQKQTSYLATIEGEIVSEALLKKQNTLACKMILLSLVDDLIDTVADFTDPSKAWAAL